MEAFLDTQKSLIEQPQLNNLTTTAVMRTRVFPENFDVTRIMGQMHTKFSVTADSIVSVIESLYDGCSKIGVLNPANGVNPGGNAVLGGSGPEESLCICSNLYPCLSRPEIYSDFYYYNSICDGYYSDRILYSENIVFFKKMVSENIRYTDQWFFSDVISCAPPVIDGTFRVDMRRFNRVLRSRIRNILSVAAAHGIDKLVLVDFGCSPLFNPCRHCAEVFYKELIVGDFRDTFKEIVFAVSSLSDGMVSNVQIFQEILGFWMNNPFYNQYISIMGDGLSVSQQGWWRQLLCYYGANLLVNNSCDNSCVSGPLSSSGNSDLRSSKIMYQGKSPDVILVFMGVWDFLLGVPAQAPDHIAVTEMNYEQYFASSYEVMLWKLRKNCPNARIFCGTLSLPDSMAASMGISGPYRNGDVNTYNQVIIQCAEKYGCYVVDVNRVLSFYNTCDGLHPSLWGTQCLAQSWIQALENNNIQRNNFAKSNREKKVYYILAGLVFVVILLLFLLYLYMWLMY